MLERIAKTGLLLAILLVTVQLYGQSPAALAKLQQRFTPEQLDEIQRETPYKYKGLLLYYSSSFLVQDQGQVRPATEAEITAIDLDQYRELRSVDRGVMVHDAATGLDLQLMSRDEFEALVTNALSPEELSAYLAYKESALKIQSKLND